MGGETLVGAAILAAAGLLLGMFVFRSLREGGRRVDHGSTPAACSGCAHVSSCPLPRQGVIKVRGVPEGCPAPPAGFRLPSAEPGAGVPASGSEGGESGRRDPGAG